MRTSNLRLALLAIAWSTACGGSLETPPASQVDAGDSTDPGDSTDTGDSTDPLPNIELHCARGNNEPGRFAANCQLLGSRDAIAYCEHVPEAGFSGSIEIFVRKPEQIVVGTPAPIGGSDPVVSISVASYSVREAALVQTLDGTQEGAIVFSRFEPGRSLRGRFAAVGFRTNPPPTAACQLDDADFVAIPAVR